VGKMSEFYEFTLASNLLRPSIDYSRSSVWEISAYGFQRNTAAF